MKECIKCLISKDDDKFIKNGNTCKECRSIYRKSYYKENKEKEKLYIKDNLEKRREYYSSPEWKEYRKKYREENKSKLKNQKQEWDKNNIDKINERQRKWRELNKEWRLEYVNEWKKNNKEHVKEYSKNYFNNRRKNDVLFSLAHRISNLIRISIKRNGYTKTSKTMTILGTDYETFKKHLESLWEPWMSWDNYGLYKIDTFNYGWDIDHIIPTSSAKTEEEVLKLNHYTNIKPLCSKVNRDIKKDMI
jgi:hypothetical protein